MRYLLLVLLISQFQFAGLIAQDSDCINLVFWNVENLFHPSNDSLVNDDEFTPEGDRQWDLYRYHTKKNRIWKTLLAAGMDTAPAIICLAEIENSLVIEDLFFRSPLRKLNYKAVHRESPDLRGIDVAILYDSVRLNLLSCQFIGVDLEDLGGRPTREIVSASFQAGEEVLTVFVNHWPSKYGGAGITEKYRMEAAKTLARFVKRRAENEIIICVGDFNDTPESESIKYVLNAGGLNLLEPLMPKVPGTLKYRGQWQSIDLIMTNHLIKCDEISGFSISAGIFSADYLLEKDDRYGGLKPYRTWQGYGFREGFSDHLPIYVKILF